MINFFYKTFLIAFISGSLSIVNLPAYAADAVVGASTTGTATPTEIMPTSANATSTTMSMGADGILSKTDNYDFSSTKTKDNLLSIITMLAIGVIGTSLLMYKKWTLDMKIAAVGCIAYIAGEIASIVNLKNEMAELNLPVVKRNDGVADQTQIDSFVKLKLSYQKAKKISKAKWMLQLGAAAVFGGALATALYLKFTEDGQLVACQSGITTAQGELATCTTEKNAEAAEALASGVGAAAAAPLTKEALDCTACSASLGKLTAGLTASKATSDAPAVTSEAKNTEVAPLDKTNKSETSAPCTGVTAAAIKSSAVTPVCASYETSKETNKAYGAPDSATEDAAAESAAPAADGAAATASPAVTSVYSLSPIEKILFVNAPVKNMSIAQPHSSDHHNLLEKMLNLLIPQVEAGITSMLGLGAGAVVAFVAIKLGMGKIIDGIMFSPIGRAVIWGMLGAAAYMASKATQAEMKIIDDNISKIDQILNDLYNLQKGVKGEVKTQEVSLNPLAPISLIPPLVKTTATTPTQTANTMNCLTANCTPVGDNLKSINGYSNLPVGIQDIASQASKLGDGLSGAGQLSSGTLGTANGLGSKLSSIKKLNDALKNKLNNALAKAGQPKINLDSKGKALLDQLKAEAAKVLKANNMSPSSFLGSAGLGSGGGSSGGMGNGSGGGAGSDKTSSATDAPVKAPLGSGGSTFVPKGSKDFDFKLGDKSNGLDGLGADAAKKEEKEEKYDIGANDIDTNKGDSIFQVISDRYLKSAYPQLLDEIPIATKIPAAAK